jgi:hypothetical protein
MIDDRAMEAATEAIMSSGVHSRLRAAALAKEAILAYESAKPKEAEGWREALKECVDTLELVERPAFKDPLYGAEVEALGNRIGYGALMASASASWREALAKRGDLVGAEYVAGPCHATVVAALKKARAMLSAAGDDNG